MRKLVDNEMDTIIGGEAITLAAVMTVLCTAIVSVIVYRMFISKKGEATIPGGWKFTWA